MKLRKLMTISVLIMCLPFMGCSNIFLGLAKKETDEALFEDAQKLMNDSDWQAAIDKFAAMSPSFQTKTEVIEAWASSYAGKCGLDFIGYFSSLGEADMTGSTIFKYLMDAWMGRTISAADCTLAQTKMEEISATASERTAEQNLFMAILGLVKMGVYLRSYLDTDGDGVIDGTPAKDVCVNDASNFPDAGLDGFITGFGLLTTNLVYLTAVLSGSVDDALTAVNSVCANPSVPAGTCGKTDPTTITSGDRAVFRALLDTGPTNPTFPMGVGVCPDDAAPFGFMSCCPP